MRLYKRKQLGGRYEYVVAPSFAAAARATDAPVQFDSAVTESLVLVASDDVEYEPGFPELDDLRIVESYEERRV